jgi:hypothetical protein
MSISIRLFEEEDDNVVDALFQSQTLCIAGEWIEKLL